MLCGYLLRNYLQFMKKLSYWWPWKDIHHFMTLAIRFYLCCLESSKFHGNTVVCLIYIIVNLCWALYFFPGAFSSCKMYKIYSNTFIRSCDKLYFFFLWKGPKIIWKYEMSLRNGSDSFVDLKGCIEKFCCKSSCSIFSASWR